MTNNLDTLTALQEILRCADAAIWHLKNKGKDTITYLRHIEKIEKLIGKVKDDR